MKTLLILFIALTPFINSTKPVTKECKCDEKILCGNVKIVEIGEDFRVRVVDIDPDLFVKTTIFPSKCGEWKIVDIGEDFRIKFVDIGEDFTIMYSEFPGLANRIINRLDHSY